MCGNDASSTSADIGAHGTGPRTRGRSQLEGKQRRRLVVVPARGWFGTTFLTTLTMTLPFHELLDGRCSCWQFRFPRLALVMTSTPSRHETVLKSKVEIRTRPDAILRRMIWRMRVAQMKAHNDTTGRTTLDISILAVLIWTNTQPAVQ